MIKEAILYNPLEGGRVKCTACARYCNIPEGKIGFCGVRQNTGGKLQLLVYGKVITGHIDPIEKKPVTHYMPGTKIFSIATTGCSWACQYCFTPETLVFTNEGVTTVKELYDGGDNEESNGLNSTRDIAGVKALTHKGRFREVKQAFRHFYDGNVLRVKPWYLPAFGCTPDHKVFASSDQAEPPAEIQARFLTKKSFLVIPKFKEEIPSESLDLADFLNHISLPRYKPSRSPTHWRLRASMLKTISNLTKEGWTSRQIGTLLNFNPPSIRQVRSRLSRLTIEELAGETRPYRVEAARDRVRLSNGKHDLPRFLKLDGSFAKLVGFYCADGSISKSANRPNSFTIGFTFGRDETRNIEDVQRLVKQIFGLDCSLFEQSSVVHLFVQNSVLGLLFKELCGNDCSTKKVPDFILTSGQTELARGFLEGYLRGDGYMTKTNRNADQSYLGANTVSKSLSLGVCFLFIKLGAVPRWYESENDSTTTIEGRTVSRHNDYMVKVLKRGVSSESALDWDDIRGLVIEKADHYLVPVKSVTSEHYSGFVYNMEVDEDHSYVANFNAVSNCQNFDISQRRKPEGTDLEPVDIATMAASRGCQGLAYTYNQPTIFIEFARDVGIEAHKKGLINIFVSNGYDTPDAVSMMNQFLDCITVDFKGNNETNFLRKWVLVPDGEPILQTLLDIRDKTKIHTEITDLVIPEVGDDLQAARKLSRWLFDNLGPDVPIHFLRFHPDYKMMNLPSTPVKTLEEHCKIARAEGLRYVYVGNVPGHPWEHTYCPECKAVAVKRYGFDITSWNLDEKNRCLNCGYQLPITGQLSGSASEERFLPVIN